jgi:DNA-directed RNA polymerase specialized sigma24 family protein
MDSIEQVYMDHAKKVYYFLLSKTNNSDVAEELTQETFFRASYSESAEKVQELLELMGIKE